MRTDPRRRRLVTGLAGLLVTGPVLGARLALTPRQAAGPFYPETLPLDDDSDLVRVAGQDGLARGRITDLRGRLLDLNGRPLRGLRVEIWQCDADGRYHHPGDRRGPADPRFQGFGHARTDAEGRYRFRTIRPAPYPGRTPHIHFAVHAGDGRPFTTQLYVAGEPRNSGDFLFNRIPVERRERVLAEFTPAQGRAAELQARFDIVLGGTPAG